MNDKNKVIKSLEKKTEEDIAHDKKGKVLNDFIKKHFPGARLCHDLGKIEMNNIRVYYCLRNRECRHQYDRNKIENLIGIEVYQKDSKQIKGTFIKCGLREYD